MADLPDYYTQTAISEAEAASFKGGLDANKSPIPVSRDIYYATDSKILRVCVVDGTWININALYLLLAGGTMAGNIVMGGNKVTGLGAPAAQDDALRYNRLEIRNAEIAAAAAIAYSKLNLTGAVKAADIEAAAGIPLTKLEDAVCSETEALTIAQSVMPTIVRKTADKTLNNVAVLENDNHLLLAIGANEVWQIDIFILCQGSTAADIKLGFSYPTDCVLKWGMVGAGLTENLDSWGQTAVTSSPKLFKETDTEPFGIDLNDVTGYRMSVMVINGANAGNVNLQWCQNTGTVANTTVLENSCIIAHQLA